MSVESKDWRDIDRATNARNAELREKFSNIVETHQGTLDGTDASASFITSGPYTDWNDNAELVAHSAEIMAETNANEAVAVLSKNHMVFQLARNGQSEAVFDILNDLDAADQAKILAGDEAIFGLMEYADNGEERVMSIFENLPAKMQEHVEYNVAESRPDYNRNHILISQARENAPAVDLPIAAIA